MRLCALLLLVLVACAKVPSPLTPASHPEAEWTLLVYMAADDDLEQAALENIKEMAEVGSSDSVNVIVQIDRAPLGRSGGGYSRAPLLRLADFHTTKRLRIERDDVVELADLGETCTCDPEPLASFVAWGLGAFPSKHTALVLWDHGGASHGFGWDVTSDNKPISIPDIGRGVASGLAVAGRARLDILGFDACLMANLGVAYELRTLSDLFIGSEEFEPQSGWMYGPVIRAMAEGTEPRRVAEEVVRSFADECRRTNAVDLCTLAAYDTTKIDPIVEALDDLGARLLASSRDLPAWYPIARARTSAEQYGAGAGERSPFAAVDAVDFASRVARTAGGENRVEDAIAAARVVDFHGRGRPNAHGLSLTFPRQAEERTLADDALLLTQRPNASWEAFLAAYLERVSADRTSPTVSGLGVTASAEAVDALGTLPDPDLADLSGVVGVMDATGSLTLRSLAVLAPTGGLARFHWPRTLPAIGDEHGLLPVTVFADPDYAEADGRIVHISSVVGVLYPEAIDVVVYLRVSLDAPPALVGVYRRTGGGPGSEVALHEGHRLAPSLATVAVDGRVTETPATSTLSLGDPSKLRLVVEPAPAGTYAVGFRVTDYAANRRWEIMNVALP